MSSAWLQEEPSEDAVAVGCCVAGGTLLEEDNKGQSRSPQLLGAAPLPGLEIDQRGLVCPRGTGLCMGSWAAFASLRHHDTLRLKIRIQKNPWLLLGNALGGLWRGGFAKRNIASY